MHNELLPYITTDLEGISGKIKAIPEHFVVEEIPLYEPSGSGEHMYVCLVRQGFTTRAIQEILARIFRIPVLNVGCAGWKDKHALVTQTFSLLIRDIDEKEIINRIQEAIPVNVLWAKRHSNKLKPGHLLGNRFSIVVLHPNPKSAIIQANLIAKNLQDCGVPNYYGVQRFGISGNNAIRGREILLEKNQFLKLEFWLKRFLLSSYQSYLFNQWLAERIKHGWFERILTGDIAKKFSTGGLFKVIDTEAEFQRFQNGEITYTGPIYGWKMMSTEEDAGKLEQEILQKNGITLDMLRNADMIGSRRTARLLLKDIKIRLHEDGLIFNFTLPKGSYATTVLREFMKMERF